jgi:hypothetical protein
MDIKLFQNKEHMWQQEAERSLGGSESALPA